MTAKRQDSLRPNIIILARHFPPHISGGARRPFLLASGLAARGYSVRVVAPCAPEGTPFATTIVPHHGEARIRAIAEDGAPGPSNLRAWLRDRIFIPDPDIRWSRAAMRAIPRLSPDDWLITTSPPESLHVAGALLKRRHGCRWLTDFRDSWLEYPMRRNLHSKGLRRTVETCLARRLLKRADAVSGTTSQILEELRNLGARGPGAVIGHFSDPPKSAVTLPAGSVNIVHSGSFTLSDPARSITPVLSAFETAGRDDIRLHLVGRLSEQELLEIGNSPARGRIDVVGSLGRDDAMAYQAGADALLLVATPQSPHVPGKLAEYGTTGQPILAIGGGDWARSPALRHATDSGALAALFATLRKGDDSAPLTRGPLPNVLTETQAIDAFLALMDNARAA